MAAMVLDGELHLWTVDVDAAAVATDATELSSGEQARAARFRCDHHRRRYVAAHVALRRILSRYTGVPPANLSFSASPHGKPYLESPIRFNLSHSEGFAMLAITCGRELGVDIEVLRPYPDAASIAAHYFHPDELAGSGAREDAFLRLWTMKEAYLKCVGMGLSRPLNSFSIFDEQLRREYVMSPVEAPQGFIASVVYPSPPLIHTTFRWADAGM